MSEKIKNNRGITVLTLGFAVLYGVRMFTNKPWYDELYTYFSFISRGPFYAAIHWPLPNNHIGYSALSGFLNYLGNPTIALRGVSYICAVINVVLIYCISGRMLKGLTQEEGVSVGAFEAHSSADNMTISRRINPFQFTAILIYTCNMLVHAMSVQGRGYTLSTTCYMLSIAALLNICEAKTDEKVPLRNYFMLIILMPLAIYAVPTSTFWVIPICLIGGAYLLFNRRFKELLRLVLFALLAAFIALMLYMTVWLAIGSNLLSKDASSSYFGTYQLDIIKASPYDAYRAGLSYMLASPYIQSMDRGVVIRGLYDYLWGLFNRFVLNRGRLVMLILLVIFAVSFVRLFKKKARFFDIYFCISIIMLPLMFVIQSVQPYLRVSSFFGAVFALGCTEMVFLLSEYVSKKKCHTANTVVSKEATASNALDLHSDKYMRLSLIISAVIGVLNFMILLTPSYTGQVAGRENDIKAVLDEYYADNQSIESIFYTDDYQEYVIKFYYDEEPLKLPLGEAELVLISDTLTDKSITSTEWPMLYNSTDFDFDTLDTMYRAAYKNDTYVIYERKNI